MISARPSKAESTSFTPEHLQLNSESEGLLQNLFAGLSFPEVPTSNPSLLLIKDNVVHCCPPMYEESGTEIAVESMPSVVEKMEEQPIIHSAQSLASLYQTVETTLQPARNYPDLPISIVSMRCGTMNEYEYSGVEQSTYQGITDLQQKEHSIIAENASSNQIKTDAESCLVSDLIAENARLSSEVEHLKRSMLPSSITVDGANIRAPSSSETIVREQQEGMIRGDQNDELHSLLLQQGSPQTATGLKYVCCGSCRTWLSAPNDAAFVRCPGCDSVNNCTPQVIKCRICFFIRIILQIRIVSNLLPSLNIYL